MPPWENRDNLPPSVALAGLISKAYGAAFVDAGQGACLPEDSGDAPGYQDSPDLLREDAESEDAQSFLQWAGEDFDPTQPI